MITNAYRIAAAEAAISRHTAEMNADCERQYSTADDALDLLRSMALWAECNGVCLRIPKPVYVELEESEL